MTKSAFPFDLDMTKYLGGLKLPTPDLDAMMAAQRKNLEVLTAANQRAFEGFGAVVRRQGELARESAESYSSFLSDLMVEGPLEDKAARQADFAKQSYERAVAGSRELSDMIARTREEAFSLINDRVRDGFAEVRELVVANVARAGAAANRATEETTATAKAPKAAPSK